MKHYLLEKIIARTNQTAKFLNKIKLRQLACTTRAKSILENTTIREEYVKCGREFCGELHGPCYYAYWKDPEVKKLKKKYICTYLSPAKDKPELLKNDNDNSNKMSSEQYVYDELHKTKG
jgi:hypothetical protein